MEQRTPEWYAARKGRITGSAVGAILGLSPFASPDDVMRRMVREYHGAESEFKGNAATEWGTAMEPHAISEFELELDKKVIPAPFVQDDSGWLGASPDGYVDNDALIEVKCPYALRNQSPVMFKTPKEQEHYLAQMHIQMLVTGREKCYFWQWSPHGTSLDTVMFDPRWISENLPKLKSFYDKYLVERDPENAWRYLDGGDVSANYEAAKKALEEAKAAEAEAKKALIEAAGEGGKVGKFNVTRVKKKGNISYQKAISDLLPGADLEPYREKESEYWRVT